MAGAVTVALGLMLFALGCYQMSSDRPDINTLGGLWIVLGVTLAISAAVNMTRAWE